MSKCQTPPTRHGQKSPKVTHSGLAMAHAWPGFIGRAAAQAQCALVERNKQWNIYSSLSSWNTKGGLDTLHRRQLLSWRTSHSLNVSTKNVHLGVLFRKVRLCLHSFLKYGAPENGKHFGYNEDGCFSHFSCSKAKNNKISKPLSNCQCCLILVLVLPNLSETYVVFPTCYKIIKPSKSSLAWEDYEPETCSRKYFPLKKSTIYNLLPFSFNIGHDGTYSQNSDSFCF